MTKAESMPCEGQHSPWGVIQSVTEIAPGMAFVSTAGHGGVKLSRSRNAKVPAYMRCVGGWYEEDCEWAIPAVVFEAEWRKWADSTTWTNGDKEIEGAKKSLINWNPDGYAQFYGVPLESLLGKSFKLQERQFQAQHTHDLIGICAWGDWKEGIPAGMVGVMATVGGQRGEGVPSRCFLVPKEDYQPSPHGFVIDPAKYQEIPPIN